ncbi:Mrs2 protein [Maudiozyma humilis]|uniref:Magnesium transporter n=1 Tax=Maudiozyma humilis TaxID=51915 RepID=A0AAV5SC51_MAUHU|nr:Mrs2 protein [Kazachstania humilis]
MLLGLAGTALLRPVQRSIIAKAGMLGFPHTLIRQTLHTRTSLSQGVPSIPPIQQKLLSLKPILPNDSVISGTIFDAKGNVIAVSQKFPKWQFLRDHNLYPRDLRKIDTSSVDVIPNVLVKDSCIVVNLLHIKALIEKDKIYVFDTADPSFATKLGVLMYDLESRLSQNAANSAYKQSYEHSALESIFINVMSTLETEFKQHEGVCTRILNDLENQINREKLRDLLIKSKDLTLFFQKSFLIRDVFDELLESDEDMAGMYLSGKKYKPVNPTPSVEAQHHTDPHKAVDDGAQEVDITDIEMLLETYYTQCDEFVQHSESLIQDIKSTEEIVNIILDANRNSLMLLELKVTIYTLGITVATLIPAFYGMNLKNFIEESYLGFTGVVVMSLFLGIAVTKANFRALQSVTKVTLLNPPTAPELISKAQTSAASSISASATAPASKKIRWLPIRNMTAWPKFKKSEPSSDESAWCRFKSWCRYVWLGKSGMKSDMWTDEERDIVWKWLTNDKKK